MAGLGARVSGSHGVHACVTGQLGRVERAAELVQLEPEMEKRLHERRDRALGDGAEVAELPVLLDFLRAGVGVGAVDDVEVRPAPRSRIYLLPV